MVAILSCLILLYIMPILALLVSLCRRAAVSDTALEVAGSLH